MIDRSVPLTRLFSPVPRTEKDSDEELFSFWFDRKRNDWDALEKEFRCVILAEAGAGKSYEMEARAKYVREHGREAFFIRIEDIEEGFEGAFEVGSAVALDNWLGSQDEAWFFLDSIDEARLDNPRAFEKAIRRFASRIKAGQHRAHIYISSRPYAWRARSDYDLLERYLPFEKPKKEEAGDTERVTEEVGDDEPEQAQSALQVYILDPLREDDIRKFAEYREAPDVNRLILDLQRANLMSMAGRPFDLEGILAKWKTDQKLGGRYELLQENIDHRLEEKNLDRAQRQDLDRERARRGARLLAAAAVLTGEPGIRVPDATYSDKGIDAEIVLGDWGPTDVQALLAHGIFNDVIYGMVRFRHREVRELLAAEWFSEHLKNGNSRHAVETLFFRELYGHEVVRPRLRPILPWLILFDDEIRRKAIRIAPEIAVEGGDAARLPLEERRALLQGIVERIANKEDNRSAQDNSAIARIAQADLEDDVLRLIEDHRESDDAIFFLGRLVWQGEMTECLPVLSQIAAAPERGIYARIAATRAVMTCGERSQKEELWRSLIESPEPLSRRLFAEILEDVDADMEAVRLLVESIDNVEPYKRFNTTGLTRALHIFIDRLPDPIAANGSESLKELITGLNSYLEREPYIERRECHVSEEFAWLLGFATHAVERLVASRSRAALEPEALAIMHKGPITRFWSDGDYKEYKDRLHELVPAWPELNDALFWQSVEETRARLEAKKSERLIDVRRVQWVDPYWGFGPERFNDVLRFIEIRALEDDKLVALSLAHWMYRQADTPAEWLSDIKQAVLRNKAREEWLETLLNPTISQGDLERQERVEKREREWREKEARQDRNRAEWVEHLKANPDVVRHPQGLQPDEFSNDQYWLLSEIENKGQRTSRSDGANWKALIPEFGDDVALAYRDAALAHWRNYTPGLRSEGHDTSSIPYSLIFAMAGLEIEARETDSFPAHLSEDVIRHALRYITWELNGFPQWLEQVYKSHPDLVLEAVQTELDWELTNAEPDKPQIYILHDIVYHAPWLHDAMVPRILDWLENNESLSQSLLRYCIHILISGNASNEKLAHLVQSKISTDVSTAQLATWYALWVDVDAMNAIPALEKWLSSQPPEDATHAAQLFITALMGGRRVSIGRGRGSFRNAEHLKALYVLMHRHIPANDDIHRAGTGAYSPELRDDAQDARDALFKQLSEIPGKETYVALSKLAKEHPNPQYRPWMWKQAYRHAEEDADLEPWSAEQLREFDLGRTRTPKTHQQLFEITIDRLVDLRNWLERGNDSLYKTWQRAESESEMRNLVAERLNSQSSERYTCAQENELPNRQRPDIWTQNPQVYSPVPIELKLLDKGWTGPQLCERLRNQLAGDYLREETADCGIMLLIWQGISDEKRWQIGERRVSLTELEDALKAYWDTVATDFPHVSAIEVILIDLTVRGEKSKG